MDGTVSLCRVGNMLRLSALKITSSSPSCSPVVSHRSVPCSIPKVALWFAVRRLPSGSLPTSFGCYALHLPFLLSSRACRCGRPLDVRGVLGRRGVRCPCLSRSRWCEPNVLVIPTNDASKWLLKASPSSMVPNKRLTPLSSHPFVQTGLSQAEVRAQWGSWEGQIGGLSR